MNKIVKRGVGVWLIFIKDRLAGAVMMFISGLMMAIAGFNGNGNDTKTLPGFITVIGVIFAFWAFYHLGYIKSNIDKEKDRNKKIVEKKTFYLQIIEAIVYLLITALGVYLFVNESFTNTILDLMCGGFTIFNGVMGSIYIFKNSANKTFGWKFRIGLTILEFAMGIYFIFASNSINASGYLIMGSITTIAGVIEVVNAIKQHAIRDAIKDSKDIVNALKEPSEDEIEDENDGSEND